MIWRQNTCANWFLLESHPENTGHLVPVSRLKSYGDYVFRVEAPLCGIGYRKILEMRGLLKILNLF